VLTSNDQNLVTAFLESHGFPEFDFIVHERAIFGKDRALNKIVKRHHLDKAQTVYVGDEPRDIQAAHKAGLKSIGVSWGVGGRESLEPAAPTILIDDAKDLLPVVREILPQ
jgi:phosphoglycolate phosphatase